MAVLPFFQKRLLLVLFVGACFEKGSGQQLTMGPIPDSLRQDAAAVKRFDETDIEIESPRKVRLHNKYVYTILNNSGDQYASVYAFYDHFHKLNSASAILYDANGRELKKVRKNEMEDLSAEGRGMLATDARFKYYRFSSRAYPYTVSFEEETELDGTLFLPEWLPQSAYSVAVEDCRLVVRSPSNYALRYKLYHFPGEAIVTEKNGSRTYTWELRNLPARGRESFGPTWLREEPYINLSPGDFEIQGYKGSLHSWADIADFFHFLWQGRDQLPEAARKKVHALVDGLSDEHEKIDVLYDFLQKNSHYVNIQFGIGGWQPFDAEYVYNNRYGDCKALSNFMMALLKEAGIPANIVLIKAGPLEPAIDTSFASMQFNHVIVLARAGTDSVWLECTSQVLPPGYLGGFTNDRYALLVNKNGGELIHTPVYGLKENRIIRKLYGTIDSSGNLKALMKTRYTGLAQDGLDELVNRSNKNEQWEEKRRSLGLSDCTITDLAYQEIKEKTPVINETVQFNADNYAGLSGNRLFIKPGPFLEKRVPFNENPQFRVNDIELTSSFQESDSLMLLLPEGYMAERPMVHRHYAFSFGSYNFRTALKGDSLFVTCHFQQQKGIYPASDFSKMEQLFNLVFRENTTELVFVKQQ